MATQGEAQPQRCSKERRDVLEGVPHHRETQLEEAEHLQRGKGTQHEVPREKERRKQKLDVQRQEMSSHT